ncbi:hypothetical protein [Nocardia testacea]|uniref:hypothetical protein n=1 Tax=Nocardia testacea TaxID=248551 RepID=UPI003A843991
MNTTETATELAAMVAIADKVPVPAAQLDAPQSVSVNTKMPTTGQDIVASCSPGPEEACEAAAGEGGSVESWSTSDSFVALRDEMPTYKRPAAVNKNLPALLNVL